MSKMDTVYIEYQTTAEEARLNGDKHFFSNKPCSRGHLGLRYVSGKHGCVECNHLRGRGEALPPLKGVYGVGFNSAIRSGIPTRENGKVSKCYDAWRRMLQRCYDQKYKDDHPTYIGVHCCDTWFDFQEFAKWFYSQPNYDKGYNLDKDLLVEGNKKYSPYTCTLIPNDLNKALNTQGHVSTWREKDGKFTFTVYGEIVGYSSHYLSSADKVVDLKNQRIKYLADKYKDFITPEAHMALLNFRFMYSLDGKIYRGFYG